MGKSLGILGKITSVFRHGRSTSPAHEMELLPDPIVVGGVDKQAEAFLADLPEPSLGGKATHGIEVDGKVLRLAEEIQNNDATLRMLAALDFDVELTADEQKAAPLPTIWTEPPVKRSAPGERTAYDDLLDAMIAETRAKIAACAGVHPKTVVEIASVTAILDLVRKGMYDGINDDGLDDLPKSVRFEGVDLPIAWSLYDGAGVATAVHVDGFLYYVSGYAHPAQHDYYYATEEENDIPSRTGCAISAQVQNLSLRGRAEHRHRLEAALKAAMEETFAPVFVGYAIRAARRLVAAGVPRPDEDPPLVVRRAAPLPPPTVVVYVKGTHVEMSVSGDTVHIDKTVVRCQGDDGATYEFRVAGTCCGPHSRLTAGCDMTNAVSSRLRKEIMERVNAEAAKAAEHECMRACGYSELKRLLDELDKTAQRIEKVRLYNTRLRGLASALAEHGG